MYDIKIYKLANGKSSEFRNRSIYIWNLDLQHNRCRRSVGKRTGRFFNVSRWGEKSHIRTSVISDSQVTPRAKWEMVKLQVVNEWLELNCSIKLEAELRKKTAEGKNQNYQSNENRVGRSTRDRVRSQRLEMSRVSQVK